MNRTVTGSDDRECDLCDNFARFRFYEGGALHPTGGGPGVNVAFPPDPFARRCYTHAGFALLNERRVVVVVDFDMPKPVPGSTQVNP